MTGSVWFSSFQPNVINTLVEGLRNTGGNDAIRGGLQIDVQTGIINLQKIPYHLFNISQFYWLLFSLSLYIFMVAIVVFPIFVSPIDECAKYYTLSFIYF